MSNRIEYIDLAKGFCIILVVMTHIIGYFNVRYELEDALAIFRMPLYFFLSGLFFKVYEDFGGFLKRKINKLIVPFAFFYITTSVLLPNGLSLLGYEVRNADVLGWQSLWAFITTERFPNMPIWFLLCLFIVNIVFYVLQSVVNSLGNIRYRIICLCAFSLIIGMIGYELGTHKVNLPMFLDTAMAAVPFFCCGYVLNRHTSFLRSNKYDKHIWILVVLFFAFTYMVAGKVAYSANDFYTTSAFSVYTCGILGTLAVLLMSKRIVRLPLISYYGRYSIIILVTHNVVLQLLMIFVKKIGITGWTAVSVLLFVMMMLYLAIIPFMIKFFPHVTAQKNVIKID